MSDFESRDPDDRSHELLSDPPDPEEPATLADHQAPRPEEASVADVIDQRSDVGDDSDEV